MLANGLIHATTEEEAIPVKRTTGAVALARRSEALPPCAPLCVVAGIQALHRPHTCGGRESLACPLVPYAAATASHHWQQTTLTPTPPLS